MKTFNDIYRLNKLQELNSEDYAKFINKETGLYDAVEKGEKLRVTDDSAQKIVNQMSQPGQEGFTLRNNKLLAKPIIKDTETAAKSAVNMMIDTKNAIKSNVVGAKAEPYLNSAKMLNIFNRAAKAGAAGLVGENLQSEDYRIAQQAGAGSDQGQEAAAKADKIWKKQYPNTPGR